jgi:hypothetical protein
MMVWTELMEIQEQLVLLGQQVRKALRDWLEMMV